MGLVGGVGVVGSLLVGVIGFAASYTTLERLAATRLAFSPDLAAWFPIGIDASILALLALDLYMIRARAPWPVLRLAAHGMTAATVWFNAAEAGPLLADPVRTAGHAVMPLLFVVGIEAARRRLVAWTGLAEARGEGVPLVRWLLEPWAAWPMFRRMKLHGISYDQAVQREKDLVGYEVMLKQRYADGGKPSVEERLPFTMRRYGYSVDQALALPAEYAALERKRLAALRKEELAAQAAEAEDAAQAEIDALRTRARVETARHRVAAETGVVQAQTAAETAAARHQAEQTVRAAERAARSEQEAVESAAAAAERQRAAEADRAAAEARRAAAETAREAAEMEEQAALKRARIEAASRKAAEDEEAARAARARAAEADRAAAEARRAAAEAELRAVEAEDEARLTPRERAARKVARMILAQPTSDAEALALDKIREAFGVSAATASEYRREAADLIANGYGRNTERP